MTLRLLQVMAGGPMGGAEAFFERLAPALARAGVEQHLAIRQDARRAGLLQGQGLAVSEHRFGGLFDFATPRALRRVADSFRPDLTLAWMSRGARMAPPSPGVLAARLGGYYNLKYYKRCRHLIGNTEDITAYLVREGWPADRAHYLPNFAAPGAAGPEPRAVHATAEDAPLILAAGRLHRNKGFDVLLRALADLPDAVLWLAGAGPEEVALRRLADELGVAPRVRWLGWCDDPGPLYRACDVFCCPSRHEPLGNVVIEAWANQAAVVAADAAGPAALVADGDTGLLVPMEDAPALARGLAEVLADRAAARQLAAAGYAAFRAGYSEEAVIPRYLALFDRLAGRA